MKSILSKKGSFTLLFLLTICAHLLHAQPARKPDVIVLRDDSKLEVLIQEVDENNIKYKKLTDMDGPVFTVKKSEIASIRYGNGEVETFEAILEVPNYYSPSQQTKPAVSNTSPRVINPKNQFIESLQTSSPDHLRGIYKYYKGRSKGGMIMGIAGTSVGVIVAGIGTGIVASATDANGNFKSYQDEQRAIKGAWMMIGGFAGAATFGTVGFIKAGKNGSKASRIKRELIRRNQPLTINVSPGYSPLSQMGYLTVRVNF